MNDFDASSRNLTAEARQADRGQCRPLLNADLFIFLTLLGWAAGWIFGAHQNAMIPQRLITAESRQQPAPARGQELAAALAEPVPAAYALSVGSAPAGGAEPAGIANPTRPEPVSGRAWLAEALRLREQGPNAARTGGGPW
jgi:hypothetical protein